MKSPCTRKEVLLHAPISSNRRAMTLMNLFVSTSHKRMVSGVSLSFEDLLCTEIELYHEEQRISVPEKIKVKIGGDGHR